MAILLALVIVLYCADHRYSYCPSSCSCPEGNTTLSCVGVGLTKVPNIPESLRQVVTVMYVHQ